MTFETLWIKEIKTKINEYKSHQLTIELQMDTFFEKLN